MDGGRKGRRKWGEEEDWHLVLIWHKGLATVGAEGSVTHQFTAVAGSERGRLWWDLFTATANGKVGISNQSRRRLRRKQVQTSEWLVPVVVNREPPLTADTGLHKHKSLFNYQSQQQAAQGTERTCRLCQSLFWAIRALMGSSSFFISAYG